MRELAVQMSNGSYASADSQNANLEFDALNHEIDRISSSTRFNGVEIAKASKEIQIQVDETDADDGSNIGIKFTSLSANTLNVDDLEVSDATKAGQAIKAIDDALEDLNTSRATVGSVVNRIEHTVSVLMNTVQRTEEARSRIQDTDYAAESANLARANVLAQAGTAMLAQSNQSPQYVLTLLRN
jgi:flagellin